MAEKDIKLKQVLTRLAPGDRWTPSDAETPIFESLTEGIEFVFQMSGEKDYVLKAGEGKVYIYHEQDIMEPEPEPPKRYNLYGEFE
tara:strand:- start:231 stop:488 length:258 start_codon:yes stop_codon:yes gene_type:complete